MCMFILFIMFRDPICSLDQQDKSFNNYSYVNLTDCVEMIHCDVL